VRGHGDFVSTAADSTTPPTLAQDYFVTFECHDGRAIYRVDISKPQAHSEDEITFRNKQRTDNACILALPGGDDGHMAGAGKGLYDISIESLDDPFGNFDPDAWNRAYKQELLMVNVGSLPVTETPQCTRPDAFEIRRLAHHRSRDPIDDNYYYQPRVSASWDGTRIAWASNFNYRHPDRDIEDIEYADIYSIRHELTPTFTTPTARQTVNGTTLVQMNVAGSMSASWTYQLKVDSTIVSTGTIERPATTTTYSWPTTSVPDGPHTLTLRVWDEDGLVATTFRTVTVNN
jgi:hypothetical protein